LQSSHIVELIDEYLDRLIEARRLLLGLNPQPAKKKAPAVTARRAARLKSKTTSGPAVGPLNRASRPKSSPRKARERLVQRLETENKIEKPTESREAALTEVLVAPAVTLIQREPDNQNAGPSVIVHPRKNVPSKRRAVPLTSVKTSTLALGGAIPTGPVVVSAQQIRIEHSSRQQVATIRQDPISSSNTIPLTAELLTQRWIQGSQSSAR